VAFEWPESKFPPLVVTQKKQPTPAPAQLAVSVSFMRTERRTEEFLLTALLFPSATATEVLCLRTVGPVNTEEFWGECIA